MQKALAFLLGRVYNANNKWSGQAKPTRSCGDCWGVLVCETSALISFLC